MYKRQGNTRREPTRGDANDDYYRTVNWTRFGNVTVSKMNNKYEDGEFSGGTWIDVPSN